MFKNSKIYTGKVIHKRFKPKEHYFKYNVFSLLIDLNELEEINKYIKFFSYNKFNIISFYDKDHGDRDGSSIKLWVKKNLRNIGIMTEDISIKLLCYPRIFGYVFNPLSTYFIYNKHSELISIFYEVKNTFGEQHTYIFKAQDEKTVQNKCKKKFYVSPFIEMDCEYHFKTLNPREQLSVVINQNDKDGKLLFASQDGISKDFNNKNLILSYLTHPLMTFKIIGAIHYEAFKLWAKRIKLIAKKIKLKNNITIESK
ncbi:DUF1365 domain-containing protein [Candidatus Pelagibacter sp. RS40]|uniref:DUF1365 domain-containing protein n=1 Tax=Candidatus Pelagibacter sp. RS40 TaxID=1977865 RepID=UPI000A1654C1|nr:DUF1365 domain-containing protein [Candidatus Pelagibacter sp. RS40]ARJ48728.1 DUF1365 domain-containing protein [Candidatus Pelagibacter sp. RS40]